MIMYDTERDRVLDRLGEYHTLSRKIPLSAVLVSTGRG